MTEEECPFSSTEVRDGAQVPTICLFVRNGPVPVWIPIGELWVGRGVVDLSVGKRTTLPLATNETRGPRRRKPNRFETHLRFREDEDIRVFRLNVIFEPLENAKQPYQFLFCLVH